MMDSIVQLIRNALCCMKDWNIFSDTVLYDSEYTQTFMNSYIERRLKIENFQLQDPYDRTTPLEAIISITQLYACLSCTYSGIKLCWMSVGKLKRIVSLLENQLLGVSKNKNKKNKDDNDDNSNNDNATTAIRLINESLVKEAKVAMKNTFIGLCVTPIGIAFFWLFGNSWHFTESGIIGGLTGLIDALTVMEVCLLPLLWFMIVDAKQQFTTKDETENCIDVLETSKNNNNDNDNDTTNKAVFTHDYLNITRYELIQPGWVPYWESGMSPYGSKKDTTTTTDNSIEKEIKQVEQTLSLLLPSSLSASSEKKKNDDNEKEQKIRKEAIDSSIDTMNKTLSSLSLTGYREYFYFVVNFIAFYGYLMSILAFYYPDDTAQPSWIQQMKFGYTNNDADWGGNFAGDLMWTIEPTVILLSPYYISSVAATTTVITASAASAAKKAAKEKSNGKSKKE